MKTVVIAGVGLIGASFGLALRKAGFGGEIIGVSSHAAIDAGLRMGAISRGASLEEAALSADLIYLAQPVDRILETLERLGPVVSASCLVTDAGSTKAMIVRRASECLRFGTFLGGHPMAGKEQRGAEAADPDLFRDRPYVLTPTGAETELSKIFRAWLDRIGSRIIEMPAPEHDAVVAFTSHLPQLISTSIAATLAEQKNERITEMFGPGLLDMTRLALSAPELWRSIVSTNRSEILNALNAFDESVSKLRDAVLRDDIGHFFCTARRFASVLREPDCGH